MTTEAIIHFIVQYNVEIIQWLLASILGFCFLLVLFRVFRRQEATVESSNDVGLSKSLQEMVVRIEKSIDERGGASFGGAVSQSQLEELKQREKEIQRLTEELGVSKLQNQNLETTQLRVKELEGKLAEYEILEDDIADLSIYKEENEKLKKELEGLRGSLEGGKISPPQEGAVGASASPGPDLVAEFQSVVKQDQPQASTQDEVAEQTLEEIAPTASDLASETMDELSTAEEPAPSPPLAPPPPPAPLPPKQVDVSDAIDLMKGTSKSSGPMPSSVPQTKQAPEAADDVMAEFSAVAQEDEDPAAPLLEAEPGSEGELNTEKMLEEMAQLVTVATDSGAASLDEAIDTEKMTSEAAGLGNS